ncbi:hypothetical protein FIU95_01655 [Microbulbifer sp. THAF38]|nr:hypothetical protein FIU95_01655 [Microbulbifer sp. THAF38]
MLADYEVIGATMVPRTEVWLSSIDPMCYFLQQHQNKQPVIAPLSY